MGRLNRCSLTYAALYGKVYDDVVDSDDHNVDDDYIDGDRNGGWGGRVHHSNGDVFSDSVQNKLKYPLPGRRRRSMDKGRHNIHQVCSGFLHITESRICVSSEASLVL